MYPEQYSIYVRGRDKQIDIYRERVRERDIYIYIYLPRHESLAGTLKGTHSFCPEP